MIDEARLQTVLVSLEDLLDRCDSGAMPSTVEERLFLAGTIRGVRLALDSTEHYPVPDHLSDIDPELMRRAQAYLDYWRERHAREREERGDDQP